LRTFRITLAYDGTDFVGWQRQATGTSVQGLLEDALRSLDDRDVTVHGAGRTDAGVHALGQVASFTLAREDSTSAIACSVCFKPEAKSPAFRSAEARLTSLRLVTSRF